MKKALILGVTGQDGSYLAEILLNSGLQVYGLVRKAATDNTNNIKHIINSDYYKSGQFKIIKGDLLDNGSIFHAIANSEPDYIYNEADQDHVAWSYEIPSYSISTTTTSVVNIMEAIRVINSDIKYSTNVLIIPRCKIYSFFSIFNVYVEWTLSMREY